KPKPNEALQLLLQLHPDLNNSKKLYKGNHSPLATFCLKPDPFSAYISNILREKEQKYFKQKEILSVKKFQTQIQQR
ncbi:23199_t:CDS:2, partial [Entrophospora sp. SA101]